MRLGALIDWRFFEAAYEPFYAEQGRPGIPTRLMVGLHILKEVHAWGHNLKQQRRIAHSPGRRPATPPCVIAAGEDAQQTAHRGNRVGGPFGSHELEDSDGIDPVYRANQAAVLAKISRSWRSRRFSRLSRCNSARSVLLSPPERRPSSRSA